MISTDRRTYLIELNASEETWMPAISWAYPRAPESPRVAPATPRIPPVHARNHRYGLQGDSPPLFVLGADGELEIVNSRILGNMLIVDRLFGAAELRLGRGPRQEVVRILRIEPQTEATMVRQEAERGT